MLMLVYLILDCLILCFNLLVSFRAARNRRYLFLWCFIFLEVIGMGFLWLFVFLCVVILVK